MMSSRTSLVLLLALAGTSPAWAAAPAAHVIALQGSAVAVRGQQEYSLQRGTAVESGDLIRVADGATVQLRFTDESIVALRSNTQFRIENYHYGSQREEDRSVFGLIKGGLRTLTGLIGKRSPDAYQMRGATATIGIRGTHYVAVNCLADCLNDDGSRAPDGMYGNVTDGTIVVRNEAGETLFTRDQAFHVPGTGTLPRQLLVPPGFLRDRPGDLARRGTGGPAPTAPQAARNLLEPVAGSTASLVTTSPADGSLSTTLTAPTGTLADTPISNYTPSSDSPAITGSAVGSSSGSSSGGVLNGSWQYGYVESVVEVDPWGYPHVNGAMERTETFSNVSLPPGMSGYDPVDWYTNAFGPFTETGTDYYGAYTEVFSKSASTDTGDWLAPDASKLFWGRYRSDEDYTGAYSSSHTTEDVHWVVGPPASTLPTSGIFTFTHVGGTQPTDQTGSVGTLTSGGAWVVNFGSLQMHSASSVTWTMPSGSSYYAYVPSGSPVSLNVYTNSNVDNVNGGTITSNEKYIDPIYSSGTTHGNCSGNGCTLNMIKLAPQFFRNGDNLSVGIATEASVSSGNGHETTVQVQVYKR